jgi:hypothetical protein
LLVSKYVAVRRGIWCVLADKQVRQSICGSTWLLFVQRAPDKMNAQHKDSPPAAMSLCSAVCCNILSAKRVGTSQTRGDLPDHGALYTGFC